MDDIAHAPKRGWYYGWNIVAVCVLSQLAVNALTYNSLPLFLRTWSVELHTPISQLHLAVAAMVLVASLLAPMVGILADKYPARRLFGCGLAGMAIFYVAIGSVTRAWQIIALYGLLAPLALTLSSSVPTNALISRWFVRRLGLALGLSAFGIGIAGVLLPPVISAILPTVGWRTIWRVGGVCLVLIVMPIVVFVLRDRPTEAEGSHYLRGDGGADRPHGHAAAGGTMDWRSVATNKVFWLLVAIYLPMLALFSGCGQNIAPFAVSRGLTPQAAGVLLSVLNLSHVLSTPICGLLSDRFGNRLPFVGMAVTMAVGAVIFCFGSSMTALLIGSFLVGLGGGLFTLLAAAIAVQFGPKAFGRVFGLSMLFLPVSSLAPFVVAKAQESTGSYTPGLMGLTVLVLVAGGLSLLLRETGRELRSTPA